MVEILYLATFLVLAMALAGLVVLALLPLFKSKPKPKKLLPGLHLRVGDLTSCPLRVFYELLYKKHLGRAPKPAPSPERLRAMNHGSETHRRLQAQWSLEGAERFVRWDYPPLLGRIDGLKNGVLYEIKTTVGVRELEAPRARHLVQVNTYLGMLRASEALIVYVDRESGEEARFRHRFDPGLFRDTLRKAQRLWDALLDEVPPEPEPSPWECDGCPFARVCPAQVGGWRKALENAQEDFLRRALLKRLS